MKPNIKHLSIVTFLFVFSLGMNVMADPPPLPGLEEIFCIRITDIEQDALDPDDNIFDAPVNTAAIPEPGRATMLAIGALTCLMGRRRR